jgi:hypothetical protein
MKINDTAVVSNDTNSAFTIAATGKAFKILSDGLYSDKIAAVIRELSCNAYDSHVAAGKVDVPFEVQLPTRQDMRFSVTDFGTGIDHLNVYDIYTRYFASTKTGSNDFVGQLGLGSKSPFSLVREFMVYSRYNGVQRQYRMYFDDTDTPRVEFLGELDCAANGLPLSGVKVELVIENYDMVDRFRDRAATILRWFRTTPQIVGNYAVINNRVNGHENSLWFSHNIRSGYRANNMIAVMGNVAYPIDVSNIENANPLYYDLGTMPIAINFAIGELEVSASRESIGYDKRTMENIRVKLDLVIADIRNNIAAVMATKITEWDARCYYRKVFGVGSVDRAAFNSLFNGIKLYNANSVEIKSDQIDLDLKTVYSEAGHNVSKGCHDKITMSRVSYDKYSGYKQNCSTTDCVIFNDIERGGHGRVKLWLAKKVADYTEHKIGDKDFDYTVYNKPDAITFDRLKELLGHPEVIYVSSMPEVPRKKKEDREGKRPSMLKFNGLKKGKNDWVETDVDFAAGGFYVDLVGKEVSLGLYHTLNIKDAVYAAAKLGYLDSYTTIYAGRTASIKRKMASAKNWINLVEYLTDKTNKFLIPAKFDKLATLEAWRNVKFDIKLSNFREDVWKLRDSDGVMAQFLAFAQEMVTLTNSSDINTIRESIGLARTLNISFQDRGTADERVAKLHAAYKSRYPMLRFMTDGNFTNNIADAVQYVNVVDATHVWFAITDPALDNTEEV